MKQKSRLYLALTITVSLLLLGADEASAQLKDIGSILGQGKSLLKGSSEEFVDIFLMIMGFAGVVLAVPQFIKHAKNDPSASDAYIKLGTGLVLGALTIQFCRLVFF